MLTWLCQSSNVATIREIEIYDAFDFEMDEACELLAELIDSATLLTQYSWLKHPSTNKRDIQVVIEYALEANPEDESVVPREGLIKIVEFEDQVICQRPTNRTIEYELKT